MIEKRAHRRGWGELKSSKTLTNGHHHPPHV